MSTPENEYQLPPPEIAELIDAPLPLSARLSPDRQWLLVLEMRPLKAIADLAQPELGLAGLRLNPANNAPSRQEYFSQMRLLKIGDGTFRDVEGLPHQPRICYLDWSPDSRYVAFCQLTETELQLWLLDIETARTHKVTDLPLNGMAGRPYRWCADSQTLICLTVPGKRGDAPEAPKVPTGPIIQENQGGKAPNRTYQNLLKSPHDKDLFDYYFQSQLARVSVNGDVKLLRSPKNFRKVVPSPNQQYLLVKIVHRPYSYLVPVTRFPLQTEVWDWNGNRVRMIADLDLAEDVPLNYSAVRKGPRSIAWRADHPTMLSWVEAQDEGDPRIEADIRDRISTLAAPFRGEPETLAELGLRFHSLDWKSDQLALVNEWWWDTRQIRVWRIEPAQRDKAPKAVFDYSWEDRYHDPGDTLREMTAAGTRVLLTDPNERYVYLKGDGASPEGDRPFIDQLDLQTGEKTRLWQSQAPYFDNPLQFLDSACRHLLTRRESVQEPPNFFVQSLNGGDPRQLTFQSHPTPSLQKIQKELIRYQRADGVELTARLYLPAGYEPERDDPLPLLMWAYPREFKDAGAASQVRHSPYQFVRTSWASPILWLALGYAILDDPAMPIVSKDDGEPNDNYVEQLTASAQAAIDEVVQRGVADRKRIAVGGHSYGAFMTANLLAHTDLFCAGIARSGAYNRTLTPFSFQAEDRSMWEAPDVYLAMSPLLHADRINVPLLLIHGHADDNPGTYPMQSERFYNALKGLGAISRLVLLPHESHGYRARESVMHMAWEMTNWLENYVKNHSL